MPAGQLRISAYAGKESGNGKKGNRKTISHLRDFTKKQNKQWKIKKIQLLNNQFKLQ